MKSGPMRRYVASGAIVALLAGTLQAVTADPAAAAPPSDPLYAACAGSGSDEFDAAELDTELWDLLNTPVTASLDGGDLVLPVVRGRPTSNAPLVAQPVPGSTWEATVEVTIDPIRNYQQAGIELWENSAEWSALTVYHSSGHRRVQLNRAGANTNYVTLPTSAGDTFWLRMASDGSVVTAQYSTDGATFAPVGDPHALGAYAPSHLGLTAFGTPADASIIDARFAWFRWTPTSEQLAACDGPLYELCAGPGSDEFDAAELDDERWSLVNAPVSLSSSDGDLVLPVVQGRPTANAPLVTQAVPSGAWEATVEVDIAPVTNYQQAGLMLWENSTEWSALTVYHSSGQRRVQLNRAGVNSNPVTLPTSAGTTFWLRLASSGSSVSAQYSIDGETFAPVGDPHLLGAYAPSRIGLTAFGTPATATVIDARFAWFRWTPTAAQLEDCGVASEDAAEFLAARERWRDLLIGAPGIELTQEPYASALAALAADATTHWGTLQSSGEPWTDLSTGSSQPATRAAFDRVRRLALAWATPGTSLTADADLLADLTRAYDWLLANRYYPTMALTGNWWELRIGYPLVILDIALLLDDELDVGIFDRAMAAVDRFTPSVATGDTAANRVWLSAVVAKRGVLVESPAKVALGATSLGPAFDLYVAGDGFHEDGSFIQHVNYPYTGGYGISFLENLATLLEILRGSPWAPTDPDAARAYGWAIDAFDPVMFQGVMMDAVRGREISREYRSDAVAGVATIRAMLVLALTAPEPERSVIRAIAARHLETGAEAFWSGGSLTHLRLGVEAVEDGAALALDGSWAFNGMGRVVQHGSEGAFMIAMSSSQIASYEAINNENHRAWYTADGMVYFYDADADHYSGAYWATVNRYRMPGTTVDTGTRSATSGSGYRSSTNTVSGVVGAEHEVTVAVMDLDGFGTDLTARKAWFLFGDELVAVGSDIGRGTVSGNGWDGQPRHVETIIENRRLASGATVTVDGSAAAATLGTTDVIAGADWAQLTSGDSEIGYVLLGGADLRALRADRTGSWSTINPANGSATSRTERYLELWLDHGPAPTGAGYQYIVLPGASVAETAAYAASPEVRILSSSAALAAVEDLGADAIGVAFWEGATLVRGGQDLLTSNRSAIVTMEQGGDVLTISVVEPTLVGTAPIELVLHRDVASVLSASAGVTVNDLGTHLVLTIDPTNAAGARFVVQVQL